MLFFCFYGHSLILNSYVVFVSETQSTNVSRTPKTDEPDQPEPTKASALPTELLAEWDDSDEEVLNAGPCDSTLNTSQEDSSAMDTTFDATLSSTAEETTLNESIEISVNESLNESQNTEKDIENENTTETSTEKEKELSEPEDSLIAVVSKDDSISTKTDDQPTSKSDEVIKETSKLTKQHRTLLSHVLILMKMKRRNRQLLVQ